MPVSVIPDTALSHGDPESGSGGGLS